MKGNHVFSGYFLNCIFIPYCFSTIRMICLVQYFSEFSEYNLSGSIIFPSDVFQYFIFLLPDHVLRECRIHQYICENLQALINILLHCRKRSAGRFSSNRCLNRCRDKFQLFVHLLGRSCLCTAPSHHVANQIRKPCLFLWLVNGTSLEAGSNSKNW